MKQKPKVPEDDVAKCFIQVAPVIAVVFAACCMLLCFLVKR